jgi:hypothetical protein
MLLEIADLFQCPEGMDMFYYLADRKELLFPEGERFICKLETEPALYSDVAVRVESPTNFGESLQKSATRHQSKVASKAG